MKILQGFLVLVTTAFLWLLPASQAVDDFRTDVREESRQVITTSTTTADIVLHRPVYNDDDQTISILSSLPEDIPAIEHYTPATRVVSISGLAEDDTRILTIFYDVQALNMHPAIDTVIGIVPYFWILILVCFPVVGLILILRS